MQQQRADYDLLAVFNDEGAASAAAAKLQKEGFGENEVFQLPSDVVKHGEFREHGPNRNRSNLFLQTQRSGPSPMLVLLFAVAFAIVIGGLAFVLPLLILTFHLSTFVLPEPTTGIEGGILGLVIGAIVGLLQRGGVRGNIGQDLSKVNAPARRPMQGAKTVVALRFPDPENISRKSKARAILINNGGKIDRSVGRNE
jgi:hypothetical protein